ncbi:hypothetical protein Mgra_00008679 [Meloidogyne graminicola]|uniref:Uncharacterized protein n=1 Tax=Meloidogyne graminicola TaxID=189291 RepID=A0A8S9ZF24_9BILA|nr:hypothetical protein Mgra_00008679 [Meloidogyne graminicola]
MTENYSNQDLTRVDSFVDINSQCSGEDRSESDETSTPVLIQNNTSVLQKEMKCYSEQKEEPNDMLSDIKRRLSVWNLD